MRGRRIDPGGEDGAVLAFVVLAMFLLIAIVALSVDFGVMYARRRAMVNTNDAAALAYAESCALGSGQADAEAKALNLAKANDNEASQLSPFVLTGTCKGAGTVTVHYGVDQKLIFAPAIGIKSQQISTKAKAVWGAVGGGTGIVPFMLSVQLTNCDIPYGVSNGDHCYFWFNNQDVGNAQWAELNLNNWGVAANASCSSAGTSSTLAWINGAAPLLTLNYPAPTYVCRDTGFVPPIITAGYSAGCPAGGNNGLLCKKGQKLWYPVNDAYGQFTATTGYTHGQVDANGNLAPPPASPHKYDIVGFTQLLLVDVWKGNTDQAAAKCNKPKDSNAWCLELEWQGFTTGGVDPGGGGDFGIKAIGLSG
jgi:hypothetical protein